MKKVLPLIYAVLLTVSCFVQANDPFVELKTSPLNKVMSEIGKTVAENYPLILSERDMSELDKIRLHNTIERLSELFSKAEPYIAQRSDTYQITLKVVQQSLEQSGRALRQNNYLYARKRLQTTATMCVSCHTQDQKLRTLFVGSTREHFESDFAFAEFNFSTRNYSEAELYYDRFLSADKTRSPMEVIATLRRLVTVYTQIQNEPGEAVSHLKKYSSLPSHSDMSRAYLNGVVQGLEELEKRERDTTDPGYKELEQAVLYYLGNYYKPSPFLDSTPQEEVGRVWLRGRLFHYMNESAKPDEIPSLLYWLALADRALSYNYHFTLADVYLRECVLRFPKHPFARLCYAEYESYLRFFYIRPDEPVLPIEIDRELKALQKLM